ncbi:hypothetical protein BH11PSE14_BH11PSE14_11190 [soil metagenome]
MSRQVQILAVIAFVLAAVIAGYFLAGGSLGSPTGEARNDVAGSAQMADRAGNGNSTATDDSGAQPRRQVAVRPVTAGERNGPDDLSNFVPQGQAPPMAVVIDQLHKVGIHSGLGAFPPPGTSPPLLGLAVPEDFVLPPGYVRHYQATDDGQRIAPILMFSPDYQFFDDAGHQIQIPDNRVVPPELAPPGLPIRQIDLPPELEPGSPPN